MHSAPLTRGTEELLVDRLHQSGVVVADDQADAGEAALDEPPDEPRPGRTLVVPCGELEPENPALEASALTFAALPEAYGLGVL